MCIFWICIQEWSQGGPTRKCPVLVWQLYEPATQLCPSKKVQRRGSGSISPLRRRTTDRLTTLDEELGFNSLPEVVVLFLTNCVLSTWVLWLVRMKVILVYTGKYACFHYFKVYSKGCAFDAAYTQAVVVVVRYCTLSLSAINTKYT